MKRNHTGLNPIQKKAAAEIESGLISRFNVDSVILFGSYAREKADPESDVDLLVVTKTPIDRKSRHEITDFVFEINLKYDTNFSTLVVDKESWNDGLYSILPIKETIDREGVAL